MEAIQRLLDRAARFAVLFGAAMIAVMALHVALDVSLRYAFNAPLPGTVSFVSYYYMVAVIFAPLAYVQSRREHFFAEIVTRYWPERVVRVLDTLCLLVTGLVLCFLTWRTGAYALTFTKAGAAVETGYFAIPTWPSRWFVPAGLGFMALYAFLQAARLTLGDPRRA
ncbi:MAG TPA: TRAP transporter small permease [Alphaproteobacteria bacterium]|jgi:TRAP-type C4-dicarboxylate transport system permease small subunit